MRSPWVYRVGAIALMFAAGLSIWVDASLSREWIANSTNADSVMPGLSSGIAFIISTLASAFGAVVTNRMSWTILFYQSKKVASISDDNERLLILLGYGFLLVFILVGFVLVYGIDLISTYHKVKNYWLTAAIVFSGDLCLMFSVPMWQFSKAASQTLRDFDSQLDGKTSSTTRTEKTVNTEGKRFS